MKSKKIVALALAAAMALSISITAFAAPWGDAEGDYVKNVAGGSGKNLTEVQSYVLYVQLGTDTTTKKQVQIIAGKEDAGSTVADGVTTTKKKLSTAQITQYSGKEISVSFGEVKSQFTAPDTTAAADNKKFVGWTQDSTKTDLAASDKASDVVLSDGSELVLSTEKGLGTEASPVKIYEVYQAKTAEEQVADAETVKNAPVLGTYKDKDGKEQNITKYTAGGIFTEPKEKTSSAVIEKDAAEVGADPEKCTVYDIKPLYDDEGTKREVTLKNGTTVDVELTAPAGKEKKDIKVFHLDGKGGSDEITDFKVDGGKIKFKYGNFSDFVVTTDTDAAVVTPSEAAASDATSTGTGTGTGTEDAAADAGNVPTGEFSALPVALLAVAALSATGVVAYKKRIAE